jgi:hypothetical protein
MIVPGRPTKALSRTESLSPARGFTSPGASHLVRPDHSVYQERTSNPSALMRIIPRTSFGLSGTPSCGQTSGPKTPRRATRSIILPAKHTCVRAHTHWPDYVRSIRNAQPQTRGFPFRSIRNASLRLAKNPIRSIGNALPQTRRFPFQSIWNAPLRLAKNLIRSIRNAQPQTRRFTFRSIGNAALRLAKNLIRSIRNDLPQTRRFPFRSIGNDRSVTLKTPIRSIRNTFGLSGTDLRSIRNESSVYQERIFGLSGTPPCRKHALSAALALLTGGLTYLTYLTFLTSPAFQSIWIYHAATLIFFWEEGGSTNTSRSQRTPSALSSRVLPHWRPL